ncbi:MAG: hypothetical protein WC333_00430 [Dehalococcoidia bacterium]|jgi:CDP-diglyceride synthetase
MLLFITTTLVVSLIAFCFWGKRFWEYRYIVLLIIACVSLVATIVVNYSIRGGLETKAEVLRTKPLTVFYINDTLFKDTLKTQLIENWDFYEKKSNSFGKDTSKKQTPVTFIIYTTGKKTKTTYIGYYKNGNQGYDYFSNLFLAPSSNDSIGYFCKKRLVYDVPPGNWLTGFSMPRKSTLKVLYVPPSEYALIPDSLKRKLPY